MDVVVVLEGCMVMVVLVLHGVGRVVMHGYLWARVLWLWW